MMAQEIKRNIVVNFINFKEKSTILHTYREKEQWKEKIFVNKDFLEKAGSICKGFYYRKQMIIDMKTR